MNYHSSLERNLVVVRLIRFDEGDEFESSNVALAYSNATGI